MNKYCKRCFNVVTSKDDVWIAGGTLVNKYNWKVVQESEEKKLN